MDRCRSRCAHDHSAVRTAGVVAERRVLHTGCGDGRERGADDADRPAVPRDAVLLRLASIWSVLSGGPKRIRRGFNVHALLQQSACGTTDRAGWRWCWGSIASASVSSDRGPRLTSFLFGLRPERCEAITGLQAESFAETTKLRQSRAQNAGAWSVRPPQSRGPARDETLTGSRGPAMRTNHAPLPPSNDWGPHQSSRRAAVMLVAPGRLRNPIAALQTSLRLWAALPVRIRQASSPNVTSRTQCNWSTLRKFCSG